MADKYRLEMLLGEGGMGFVWSAYNRELELPVAIKLLRAGRNHRRLAERLRLEARAAARLVHPSIVRIFDVAVTDGGEPFIVMELLTGETLAEALSRGPLGAVRAVQLLLPIADALVLAHAKGIVHRDLKPENVFLSRDGEQLQPKLLDFGIAKLGDGGPSYPKLTEDGVVLGSPHYMSPEQVAGEDVDPRTDAWSLCVVLYKALTGSAPFIGADKRAVMDAILSAPLPQAANLDAALNDILRWGLTKNPLDRPQSVRELGQALARWLVQQGVEEDACGTPLAAKWLGPPARCTVPCGPARERGTEHDTDPEQRWFTSEPPVALPAPELVEAPAAPRRGHHRELLAALGLLILGGSLAWTDSARTSVKEPRAEVSVPAEPSPAGPAPAALSSTEVARPSPLEAAPEAAATPARAAEPAPKRARVVRKAPQLPF